MKKFIILSFMFLFFAGISNNANAQKEPPHTWVEITYDWHCKKNPNAVLTVDFYGYDKNGDYVPFHYVGKVGSDPVKKVGPHSAPWICYRSVTVVINVRDNFTWASKTVHASDDPYIYEIPVTLDIYSGPSMYPCEDNN